MWGGCFFIGDTFFFGGDGMDDKQKIEFRCLYCNKLLGYVSGDSEVKCNRCGALNLLDADTGEIDCIPRKDEKHRITSSGMTFR